MAANLQKRGSIAFFCKRLNQVWAGNFRDPVPGSSPTVSGFRLKRADLPYLFHCSKSRSGFRRQQLFTSHDLSSLVHSSSYDKNPEEHGLHSTVPDHALESESDGKYWALHPETGVFAPPIEEGEASASRRGGDQGSTQPTPNGSVLDQKAWFRSIEGVEKPPPTD